MDAALKAYVTRWQAVKEIERHELRTATVALRWQQLNAVFGIAIGLGLNNPPEDEFEIYQRWAKLKEKVADQRPAA